MKRWQAIALILMAVLAISLFCGVAVLSQALFKTPDPAAVIAKAKNSADSAAIEGKQSSDAAVTFTPRPTATPTSLPTATNTPVPTATEPPLPTATSTRVVIATPTLPPTFTPPVPTATNTPVVKNNGGGTVSATASSSSSSPAAAAPPPPPTSQYPFKLIAEPLSYKTNNHIFVILAKVVASDVPQPGYRLVGTHSPTGFQWESPLSCPDLCKASGPEALYDKKGKMIKKWNVQKGNLFFESPNYDTGVWSLMLVDAHGQRVSDVFQLALDSNKKQWFYYVFSR